MNRRLREAVKRFPVLGPAIYSAYLHAFHGEGRVSTIRTGTLEGLKFRRFMRTYNDFYAAGDFEPDLQRAFSETLKPGQVVYDVGANVGFMTMVAARLVGPEGAVVAFEPSRETGRQLLSQIELNGFKNVTLVRAAVSDRVGTASFTTHEFSDMNRLAELGTTAGIETVPTTTLDAIALAHRPPNMIKLDVEGAEILVLRGATRVFREHRPILLAEIHSEQLNREFRPLMREFGYRVEFPGGGGEVDVDRYERFVLARPAGDP